MKSKAHSSAPLYLKVNTIAGRNLMAADKNGLSDPYCELKIGTNGKKQKGRIIKKTLNPEWKEIFTFPVANLDDRLYIKVWDKDKIGSDFLGEVVIDFHNLTKGVEKTEWYKLGGVSSAGTVSGEVQIGLTAIGFGIDKVPESPAPPNPRDDQAHHPPQMQQQQQPASMAHQSFYPVNYTAAPQQGAPQPQQAYPNTNSIIPPPQGAFPQQPQQSFHQPQQQAFSQNMQSPQVYGSNVQSGTFQSHQYPPQAGVQQAPPPPYNQPGIQVQQGPNVVHSPPVYQQQQPQQPQQQQQQQQPPNYPNVMYSQGPPHPGLPQGFHPQNPAAPQYPPSSPQVPYTNSPQQQQQQHLAMPQNQYPPQQPQHYQQPPHSPQPGYYQQPQQQQQQQQQGFMPHAGMAPAVNASLRNSSKEAVSLSANREGYDILYQEIKFEKKIGVGGFGEVWKGEWAGTAIAIKKILKADISDADLDEFAKEILLMSKLRHPNIVQFLGACLEPEFCLLTEFMERGSLFDVVATQPLSWDTKVDMCSDITKGMIYLHTRSPPILHRDIKSLNILVTKDWKCTISDFGLTRIKDKAMLSTRCGSPAWSAPEILRGENYNEKADVFSFGVVMWEIISQQPPYKGMNPNQLIGMVAFQKPGLRPPIPQNCPVPQLRDLMIRCWDDDPNVRPEFTEVLPILRAIKSSLAQYPQ